MLSAVDLQHGTCSPQRVCPLPHQCGLAVAGASWHSWLWVQWVQLGGSSPAAQVLREGGSKDGEAAGRSTYLLNAQLVDKANSTQQAQQAEQAQQAGGSTREQSERAAAAAVDAAVRAGDQGAEDLVGRLREMGTALTGALAAGVESWMHGGRDEDGSSGEAAGLRGHHLGRPGGEAATAGDEAKPAGAAEESKPPGSEQAPPPPPSPPPHRRGPGCGWAHPLARCPAQEGQPLAGWAAFRVGKVCACALQCPLEGASRRLAASPSLQGCAEDARG